MLAVEIEGGVKVGGGVALEVGSGRGPESFDLLRICTTYIGFRNCRAVPKSSGRERRYS